MRNKVFEGQGCTLGCPGSSLLTGLDCLAKEESTPRCCRHLGFPSPLLIDGSLALALPQQQVAFAAWHLFLEGGCQEGANPSITHLVCPRESLHEGGVCAAWGSTPGPVLAESPLLTLQVSRRRAEICVLGRGGRGDDEWEEVIEKGQGTGLVLSPGGSIKAELLFHFTERGRKETFTEGRLCVRSCAVTSCGIEGHDAGGGSMATVPQEISRGEITELN